VFGRWTRHEVLADPDDVPAGHVTRFRRADPDKVVRPRTQAHPAIVSVETFTRTQLLRRSRAAGGLEGRRRVERGLSPAKHAYVLRGMVRCGYCARKMGVDVEQVAGQDRVHLSSQELGPRGSSSPAGGIDACGVQDLPDGGGADLVAETGEFAVDAAIPPGQVLGGQTDGERAQPGWDRGAPGPGRRRGPPASNESAVPAQHRRWSHQQTETSTARQQADQRGDEGSTGPARPGPWCTSLEHCELMAQHVDFDVVRGL
jgi:hypothetical protein